MFTCSPDGFVPATYFASLIVVSMQPAKLICFINLGYLFVCLFMIPDCSVRDTPDLVQNQEISLIHYSG